MLISYKRRLPKMQEKLYLFVLMDRTCRLYFRCLYVLCVILTFLLVFMSHLILFKVKPIINTKNSPKNIYLQK